MIHQIEQFVIFGITIYLRHWFECGVAFKAPKNDFDFYKSILKIKKDEIRKSCLTTFNKHDQYLKNNLLALAFFDNRSSCEELRVMVNNLKKGYKVISFNPQIQFADLFDKSVLEFFKVINFPPDFLKLDPSFWSEDNSYIKIKQLVDHLNVLNDTSERGCALAKRLYNGLIKSNKNSELLILVDNDMKTFKCR